jgi:acyl-CoA synthetase (NDP forming)
MRVLGPNIFGIYSRACALNATFGPKGILPGSVAIVSQSGAIGSAMIGKTAAERIGLSAMVSIGNKADIDESDLIEHLMDDPSTRVIMLYMEGVRDGERFLRALRRATARKPVVVIKAGRSRRGALAAASHTGSLAGSDDVFDAVVRQCGAIRAENIQEALDWSKFLAGSALPAGRRALILTNGGGIGVLAADACEKHGVGLYDDGETLRRRFRDVVPPFGSLKNPVDLTGQATPDDYDSSLGAALELEGVHAVVCLYCETGVFDPDRLAEIVTRRYGQYRPVKPVVFSFFGGQALEDRVVGLRKAGVPVFSDVYQAVACLGASFRQSSHLADGPGTAIEELPGMDIAAARRAVDGAAAEGRTFLLAHEARELMGAAGVGMPESRIARSLEGTVAAARETGFPVVMKVVSKDIVHKSDAGGVALDLEDEREVVDAYQAIMQSCRAHAPHAVIEGVEVTRMVAGGVETIVGARRDPTFGPTVMFGLGGIYVEVLRDVTFRASPVDRREAMRMVSGVRSYPLLLGVRGEERKDIEGILDAILRVQALLQALPRVTDVELNPLRVFDQGEGVVALDARVLLAAEGPGGHPNHSSSPSPVREEGS